MEAAIRLLKGPTPLLLGKVKIFVQKRNGFSGASPMHSGWRMVDIRFLDEFFSAGDPSNRLEWD